VKHNKYKNSGILFELLVHTITADSLSGKNSPAINILRDHFVKSELSKEYKLHETLVKNKKVTEGKADIIISTILEASKKLNRTALKKEKYNLIKEIKNHYNLEEFFKTKLPNYKIHAAFYNLMEMYNSGIENTDASISNKLTLLEHLTNIPQESISNKIVEEFDKQDKDVQLLSYKFILEKFNTKYNNFNNTQKLILKEYLTSVDNTSKLRDFYNEQISEIKSTLTELNRKVKDKVTQIKVNEIITLMKEIDKLSQVKDNNIVDLLQYCELLNELEKING